MIKLTSNTNSNAIQADSDTCLKDCLKALIYLMTVYDHKTAQHMITQLLDQLDRLGLPVIKTNTPYINTLDTPQTYPGDDALEARIQAINQWNAMIMVVKANQKHDGIGGHISSYASSAQLYEVGFNHFFRGYGDAHNADQIYFQGHASPGIYARSFLEGRLSEDQLAQFRQELGESPGLSSYPHPYLMPSYWQFPTVSMGLGPILAIYQARFNKYLVARGILKKDDSRVWCYIGDGETSEPETLGALFMAAREKLDNLIFVINCNLQRLDGPVHGNGKIIQELESIFHGAGWHVIKLIWSRDWDALLDSPYKDALITLLTKTLDGAYQKYSVTPGSYIRKQLFSQHPELAPLLDTLTDEDLENLRRGGHDTHKIYAAYKAACDHQDQPIVILAKTIKGYGLGDAGEGRNSAHQQKKLSEKALRAYKDFLDIPIHDDDVAALPFYKPSIDSPEMRYMHARREALGGYLPERRDTAPKLELPDNAYYLDFFKSSGSSELSTTMAFVRILTKLLSHKSLGKHIVPIVPDECRTFGMEALFRQIGIYASEGQQYEPVDRESLLYYKESRDGQMLEEGISEAGGMASFIAAGTSYTTHNIPMVPMYCLYSMFGFQRIGDLLWLAGDIRARGFVLGGTAGRTTLNGEGLQHQDGHSQLIATTNPACIAYDPAFRYEIAVIIQNGLKRMLADCDDLFYYLTISNENYQMPERPETATTTAIMKGAYLFKPASETPVITLLGSGSIMNHVTEAQAILEADYQIATAVYSVTSYQQLRREALDVDRYNRLNLDKPEKRSYLQDCFCPTGHYIAASDNMALVSDQIAPWLPNLISLGTDGFGRSATRAQLRRYFEVDTGFIVYTALYNCYRRGLVTKAGLSDAMQRYAIQPDKAYGTMIH